MFFYGGKEKTPLAGIGVAESGGRVTVFGEGVRAGALLSVDEGDGNVSIYGKEGQPPRINLVVDGTGNGKMVVLDSAGSFSGIFSQ